DPDIADAKHARAALDRRPRAEVLVEVREVEAVRAGRQAHRRAAAGADVFDERRGAADEIAAGIEDELADPLAGALRPRRVSRAGLGDERVIHLFGGKAAARKRRGLDE